MGAPPAATTAPAETSPAAASTGSSIVPFMRGSGRSRWLFYDKSGLTLDSATQSLGPIDVKAYDYMRAITVRVETTATADGGTAATLAANGPFNSLVDVSVRQPNSQTMYQVSDFYHGALINKYGYSRRYNDPRAQNDFGWSLGSSGGALTLTYEVRIPFELDLRDALGSLPNKDAAAPFQLDLSLNTLANVFPNATTSPTLRVRCYLEAYNQPPATLGGESVQTTPPNMNTLSRWTEQNITMSTGQFDARVRKMGNYIRMLIPVMYNSSNQRISDSSNGWADPVQIVLDEDVKDNIALWQWKQDIYEQWGYGAGIRTGTANTFTAPALDSAGGRDTGVWPYQYFFDGRGNAEDVNLYLPTIESEDYLLRANWGSSVSKMTVLVNEVLPVGDIFN